MILANKGLGVEPFPATHAKTKMVDNAFGMIEQKEDLYKLKVIYGNSKYPSGTYVYVSGEAVGQPFASKIRRLVSDSPQFILLPEEQVIFYGD